MRDVAYGSQWVSPDLCNSILASDGLPDLSLGFLSHLPMPTAAATESAILRFCQMLQPLLEVPSPPLLRIECLCPPKFIC